MKALVSGAGSKVIASIIIASFVLSPLSTAAQESPPPEVPADTQTPTIIDDSSATAPADSSSSDTTTQTSQSTTDQTTTQPLDETTAAPESFGVLSGDGQTADPIFGPERQAGKSNLNLQPDEIDGSLRYEYPLTLPPGRNGMAPQLSLTYSSANTDQTSAVGYGWSLNIPYIERINKKGANKLYSEDYFFFHLGW